MPAQQEPIVSSSLLTPGARSSSQGQVLAFASPPTPNGDLHLGHLSGPYLAADVYVRAEKMRGRDAYYLTGTDDNQCWVAHKADQTGSTPEAIADKYADLIRQTLEASEVAPDHFWRPVSSPYHSKLVLDLFTKLYAAGQIVAKDAPSLYCDFCERYLFEVHVTGICPYCGSGCSGNACEDCGRPNDCVELIDPVCKHCGRTPGVRTFRRLFFPLSPHAERLRDYSSSVKMRAHNRGLLDQMLADGLPDIAASHISDWGIPVPLDGFGGQSISAWLEMAPGYLAATHELADRLGQKDDWKGFWYREQAQVVQFFGFDNCWCHTVMYPALLAAYDPMIELPVAFVANKFYRLDGQKFSTSRGHAIWGRELVEDVSADRMRFYLAYTAPEDEETNFVLSEFHEMIQRELEAGWLAWLGDLGARVSEKFDGVAPVRGELSPEHEHFLHRLGQIVEDVGSCYNAETFSTRQATRALCDLVGVVRQLPTAGDSRSVGASGVGPSEEERTVAALELLAAKHLALLSAPIMPDFAARLWRELGYDLDLWRGSWAELYRWIPAGQRIGSLSALL